MQSSSGTAAVQHRSVLQHAALLAQLTKAEAVFPQQPGLCLRGWGLPVSQDYAPEKRAVPCTCTSPRNCGKGISFINSHQNSLMGAESGKQQLDQYVQCHSMWSMCQTFRLLTAFNSSKLWGSLWHNSASVVEILHKSSCSQWETNEDPYNFLVQQLTSEIQVNQVSVGLPNRTKLRC